MALLPSIRAVVSRLHATLPLYDIHMRKTYDFSKARRNPYARRLKRQVTIRLEHDTIEYFRALAGELGIPYQTLINLYLRDCATSRKRLSIHWRPAGAV